MPQNEIAMNSPCKKQIKNIWIAFIFLMHIGVEAAASEPKCPAKFEEINELITVKPNSVYTNRSSKLCITKNGGFHVLAKAELVISNAIIILANDSKPKEQGALATLEPGSVVKINNVQIKAITKPTGKEKIKSYKGKTTSQMQGVSKVIIGATTPDLGIRLEINGSTFSAEQNYSLGGILIQPSISTTTTSLGWTTSTMSEMALQRDAFHTAGVSGWIRKSEFKKIFTPITLIGANELDISNNSFSENPGGNIVTSGSKISIVKNKINFPGNGYVGDGITIYTIFENSSINSNIIVGGSCYGIQIANPEIRNVIISDNHISSGITNGLHISNEYRKLNKNIKIRGNYISGNAGFGIGIDSGVHGISIASNVFAANAKLFGEYDIAMSKLATAQIEKDNLSALGIDPTWAEGLLPNRTHVNKSIRVFSF